MTNPVKDMAQAFDLTFENVPPVRGYTARCGRVNGFWVGFAASDIDHPWHIELPLNTIEQLLRDHPEWSKIEDATRARLCVPAREDVKMLVTGRSSVFKIIKEVALEKGLPISELIDVLQQAMQSAARRKLGEHRELEAVWNPDTEAVEVFEFKTVSDAEELEDPEREITLADARLHDPECQVGDALGLKLNTEMAELGRIAAQTAKQVIIQKLRDAEREQTFAEFKERKGEIITGIVRRFERGNIIVELGRAEAVLPKAQQVAKEDYRQGMRIQAYVMEITRAAKMPQVVLSRSHPGLLMKLFELEVPEIEEGVVRIEAAAREPGFRAKIAVSSMAPDVDPVGACVGMKGARVQAVVAELGGEAIDIVPFSEDPARFVVNALAPAHVSRVFIDEVGHSMEIVVPDDQLSKAIGRRGQNVRLAAQLTGWRIDIFSETKFDEMTHSAVDELSRIQGLDEEQVDMLIRHGFRQLKEVADAEAFDLAGILGLDDEGGEAVLAAAEAALDELILEEKRERERGAYAELPPSAD